MNALQLRPLARKLVQAIRLGDALPVSCISEERVENLSSPTSLQELSGEISVLDSFNQTNVHESIVWVEAFLRNPKGIVYNNDTNDAAIAIQAWVAEAIMPSSIFAIRSHFDPSSRTDVSATNIARWRLMAVAGIRLLTHLQGLVPALRDSLPVGLVTSLASYTDARDAWTESEAANAANALLEERVRVCTAAESKFTSDLITELLQDRIKPLFMKSKNTAITAQGRKADFPLPAAIEPSASEVELKPWKFRDLYIVPVFGWVLSMLDKSTIEKQWPLVIPPLLAILDDETASSKAKGCELLKKFLEITPSSLLHRTGLGEVFQKTLLPCLSYLPSLTSEDESSYLLEAVYPALLSLTRARYPGPESTAKKMTALNKIFRIGILKGFAHAGEYVRVATMLMCKTTDLISEMGIMSVTHLKDLLPLLNGVLSGSLGPAHPPLLLAAALALQSLILNAWPRMSYYRGEVLKGLTISWCVLKQDYRQSHVLDEVRLVLRQNVALLRQVLSKDSDAIQEVDLLLHDNPQVSDLLPS